MIDKNQKLQILDEILKSNSFINSKLNAKLLTYLVKCEISGKTPSEYSIAIDVFKKDASFNPNEDTLIRVSVYNLRKKLERYYQNMGKRTKLRVKIPKGHYEVIFFNYSKENIRDLVRNPYVILLPVVFILLFIILYLLTKQPQTSALPSQINYSYSSNLLDSFINSENPKIISLGDDFIYYSDFSEFNTTPIRKMYRNSMINNEGEFEKFKSEEKQRDNFKKLPFSFFNQAAVWPLPHLVKLFKGKNVDFLIKSATNLNSNDIKSHDIVFLGSFWTLGILNQIIENLGISYNIIGEEKLEIKSNDSHDSLQTYIRTGVPAFDHIDYSLFLKVPGPNKKTIYLIVSFYATGSVGIVKYLSNQNSINELNKNFEENYENFPDYYLILFKSKGYNREVLSTELLFTKEIDPSLIVW
ncbi:MAG: hypothetical protein KDC88_08075 [Ignavibacteriae bacterium]|nr:hypothetical protein [Ignavibacteriota bacterium]MCB9207532.1 hypothetical protein [Ignavibacteriales bacterium]MCB9209060.1 hypothetical protein [Ignavibacteriales bacterium]MCB9218019.1 hypothetical protein [Ignavibacteriales bacterium]MCB9260408.1 hypothetical protein [Ignavibacteriales bacterium]